MEFSIILRKHVISYCSSTGVRILSRFLVDDIGGRKINSILDFIKNDKLDSVILNASYLKKHNDKIKIYFFYDGYEKVEDASRANFEIDKEYLAQVIKKWSDVFEKTYKCMIIEIEDGNIDFDLKEKSA